MTDSGRANLYLAIGLGSLAGIALDAIFYFRWWIFAPLLVVMALDILWGIAEAG
jgi:hypothetical protein